MERIKRFNEHMPKTNIYQTESSLACHLVLCSHNYTDVSTNFKLSRDFKQPAHMDAVDEYKIYMASEIRIHRLLKEFRLPVLLYSHRCRYTQGQSKYRSRNHNIRYNQSAAVG